MESYRRRTFLASISTVSLVGAGFCSTASAEDDSHLRGKIVDHNGDPIPNREVTLSIRRGGHREVITDNNGEFEADVPDDETCDIGFYRYKSGPEPPEPNGVPHLYVIGAYSTGAGETNLGKLQIPKGHLVQIRALDSEGNPVGNVNADLTAKGATGHYLGTGSGFSTNYNGYVSVGSQYTGVELIGNIEFSMAVPTGDGGALKYSREFYVDEPLYITVQADEGIEINTLEEHQSKTDESSEDTSVDSSDSPSDNQENNSETTSDSTNGNQNGTTNDSSSMTEDQSETDGSTSTQSRGFFSNNSAGDELEMLSDPFTLTVAGFVLSAAGIAYQLMRGR